MKFNVRTLIAAAMMLPALVGCNKQEPAAKYVFLFIGDGMGTAQVGITESYLSYQAGVLGGEQLLFTTFPCYGMANTFSANGLITDSSAAGTAISNGNKTCNGMLGVEADGVTPSYSVALALKQDFGYNVGIFSSVPVNHATPAAFYGHDTSRNSYYKITTQMPESGFEFFGGSGFLGYDGPDHDKDSESFLEENGYTVVFGQKEFERDYAPGKKIVMSSNPVESHRNSVANYASESDTLVALSQMMRNCLQVLGDKKPFFVMCEGGEIDWECHANKTMPAIQAIIKMDEAVKVAYDFYLQHPKETLIIVTADHETGGVTLGSREGYQPHWKEIIDGTLTGPESGIAWTSWSHTGNPVPVYAIGKGAEKFTGRFDNTEFKGKILGL